ncbi:MAG: glycosyltransferase [Actinomycetes bacterium]
MNISVVVPSYHRPDALTNCLRALALMDRTPDEIIVVIHASDAASRSLLEEHPEVTAVEVDLPGAVRAMTAGACASMGEVIAFTDDDACPRSDWLARIEAMFDSDPTIAAVGGRDVIHEPDGSLRPMNLADKVGVLTWYGRLIGNHHRGQGGARDVQVLKGVNGAYRRADLALPSGLRGKGTQIHFEVAMGIRITQSSRRLVYDPAIMVDHFPAVRQDADTRGAPPVEAVNGHAYNLTTSVAMLGPAHLAARTIYAVLAGDFAMPGLLRALIARVQGDRHAGVRLRGAVSGNLAAARDWARGRRPTFVSPPPRP